MNAKVVAINSFGASTDSATGNGATMPSVANAPASLTRDNANTLSTQVVFSWTIPSSNGGAPILDYTIQWDQGTGTWITLASAVSTLTYTKTGVSAGVTYKFKVQARNAVGLGAQSSEFSIIAATTPGLPTALIRDEVNTSKTQAAFTWTAPASNGGSAVIDYIIMWD